MKVSKQQPEANCLTNHLRRMLRVISSNTIYPMNGELFFKKLPPICRRPRPSNNWELRDAPSNGIQIGSHEFLVIIEACGVRLLLLHNSNVMFKIDPVSI